VNSRIYRGHAAHARLRPKTNRFRYAVVFLLLDLDELDELGGGLRLFSHNGHAPVGIRDRDHGARDGSPLRPWIDDVLGRAGIDLEGGTVLLLSIPRMLGFGFYPVSFWYCRHADGTLRAVLAEVRNTFGSHHAYLLHEHGAPLDLAKAYETSKAMHVSPFIGMDARYRFELTEPGETVSVRIHDVVEGSELLIAQVELTAEPLTDANLARALLRFQTMSLRALVLIHWQAAKLVSKGIRLVADPGPPKEELSL
jgi:DUF1365 family protein